MHPRSEGVFTILKRIWSHLSLRRKWQFLGLFVLMLLSSMTEVVSLGSVLPFLSVLTNPEKVFQYFGVRQAASFLGITSPHELLLPITAVFVFLVLFAASVRLALLWTTIRFSNACSLELSIKAFDLTLRQPYKVHTERNSSELISGLRKVEGVQGILQGVLVLFSSTLMMVFLLSALIAIIGHLAIWVLMCFAGIYGLLALVTRKRLHKNSEFGAVEANRMVKILQEGLGGIREILLDGTQGVFVRLYQDSMGLLLKANGNSQFLGVSPRQVVEALAMIVVAGVAYTLSLQDGGLISVLPMMGAVLLGAQRLLPAMQQAYVSWSGMAAFRDSLFDALDLLDQPVACNATTIERIRFENEVRFHDVSFRYKSDAPYVLKDLNLVIPKGSKVGFVGSTGCGKSTTIDLLLGLLTPESGDICVDGQPLDSGVIRNWQSIVAHVPQAIFLSDGTFAENIAFGIPAEDIDISRVQYAARQAQIADFIEAMPQGYFEVVGERGVRLSGGQRQRIGIARALYKDAEVLVLDEATSALDNITEKKIMGSIDSLSENKTIIVVAHRLSTVENCDIIYEFCSGCVIASGNYQTLLEKSESFRHIAASSV